MTVSGFFLTILAFVACLPLAAQEGDSLRGEKDLIDLIGKALGKSQTATDTNNRKASAKWSVVPSIGYTLQNGFIASFSTNVAFFTGGDPFRNQSIIYGGISYTQKNQLTFSSLHNIWMAGNRLVLSGDYRYWIYPQQTYGLGGHTRLRDGNLLNYRLLRISQYAYRRTANDWYIGGGYTLNYNHRISEAGNPDGSVSDFKTYDGREQTVSSGLALALMRDKRQNQNNPVAGGQFLTIQFLNNFQWLGSTFPWRSVVVDGRRYVGVGKKENKLAFWLLGWFAFNQDVPYLDLPATAWDAANNTGRGYIQGRFRGKNLLYGEAEYRLTLTANGLFGAVFFANAQSVTDWPTNRFTRIHPAAGAGLRMKLNKRSGANIALDYGFGADGSRGFFVNLGEVF